MEAAGQSVRRRAAQTITGVPASYEADREELGTDAAAALEEHRFRSPRIEVTATELTTAKTIGPGNAAAGSIRPDRLEPGADRLRAHCSAEGNPASSRAERTGDTAFPR